MMELQRPGLHSAYMGRQVTIYYYHYYCLLLLLLLGDHPGSHQRRHGRVPRPEGRGPRPQPPRQQDRAGGQPGTRGQTQQPRDGQPPAMGELLVKKN